MGSLREGHVPLLFRIVFDLGTPLLHTRCVTISPLFDTTHTVEAMPSTCISDLARVAGRPAIF